MAINSLIKDAVRVFTENKTDILNGSFGSALLEKSQYKAQIKDIIDLSVEKSTAASRCSKRDPWLQNNYCFIDAFVSAASNTF